MIRKSFVGLTVFLFAVPVLADKKLDDRMMHAASILQEIRGSLDEPPPGLLENAHAVAVFPEFVKVGLLGGAQHGRGVLAKRQASGEWSKPAFVRLTSGSIGLQFGISMSQLIVVFKDPKAVEAISGGQFTLGADAAYAAGNLGGMAGAGTDNKLENQTVALARSRGLFAGAALEGGVLRIEKDSNVEFYNDAIGLDGRRLLEDREVELPPVAEHFLIVLDEAVPPLFPPASAETTASSRALAADALQVAGNGNQPNTAGTTQSDLRNRTSGRTPEAVPAAKGADGNLAQQPAQTSALDAPAAKGTDGNLAQQPAQTSALDAPAAKGTDGNLAQRPAQTSALDAPIPGDASSASLASSGSWVTPDGMERLPHNTATDPASAAVRKTGQSGGVQAANHSVRTASWFTPQGQRLPAGEYPSWSVRPSGPGLMAPIAGKLVDGAMELALESVRNKPEVQGAKIAASLGKGLASGIKYSPRLASPKGSGQPAVTLAVDGGEWVKPVQSASQVASGVGNTLASATGAPLNSNAPALAASVSGAGAFTPAGLPGSASAGLPGNAPVGLPGSAPASLPGSASVGLPGSAPAGLSGSAPAGAPGSGTLGRTPLLSNTGMPRVEKMGPPPPSEWPEAWRQAQKLAGACEPDS